MTTDAKILTALRANPNGVSGAQLAEQLSISRAAIWARMDELRQVGYDIEASPHFGYKLVSSPDALHADDLLARLHCAQLGGHGRAATMSARAAGTEGAADFERPEPSPDASLGDGPGRSAAKPTTRKNSSARLARPAAGPKIIGRDIQVFEQTTSTNDVAEKLARDGVKEGAVVFAESQTKGRGRLGRKWQSPTRKGLWFSVLLRPKMRPQETSQLTVASATALRRAIQSVTGLSADIKWPNDLLIGGKKVVGILTEMSAEVDRVRYLILGIGVDVNQEAHEFPAELRGIATSLKIALGEKISRAELATAILRELDADYARINAGEFAAVADEWEAACATIGRNVTVHVGDRTFTGRAEALDDDGALLVRTEHGHLERITGGDVTLEK